MAAPLRRTEIAIKDAVFVNPFEYDFHQAVQLIEALSPSAVPLGEGSDPTREALRIKAHLTLAMPTSEIERIETFRPQVNMYVNFVSIGSRQGPLPETFTESLIERARLKDAGFRNFLDIFNHRLASLWYRFRKKVLIGFAQTPPQQSPLGQVVSALGGVSAPQMLKPTTLQESFFISAQRLMWPHVRSKVGLVSLIQSYLGMPARVHEYVGGWNNAREEDISRIGLQRGQHHALGYNMMLGTRSWQQDKGIHIDIGPLSWAQYIRLVTLKNHTLRKHMQDAIYAYVGINRFVNMRIFLDPLQMEFTRLGTSFELGRSTWVYCGKKETLSPFCKFTLPKPFTVERI